MKGIQKEMIKSYQRVQVFLTANPLPPPATYGTAKEQLDDVVTRLTTHSDDQATTTRLGMAETAREQTLRRGLREKYLMPIARIANAALRGSPGIDKATHLPSPQIPTLQLLSEAAAFRQAATPYEETFVTHGMSADFLARLDAAIEELRQSVTGKDETRRKRTGASSGLADELRRGRQAVEMLNAFVIAQFAGKGEVLDQWRRAKKVLRTGGGRSSPDAPSGPVPAPTPAPVPVPAPTPAATPVPAPSQAEVKAA